MPREFVPTRLSTLPTVGRTREDDDDAVPVFRIGLELERRAYDATRSRVDDDDDDF
jgi:hypothetical protein